MGADGGVFAFGDARFLGSLAGAPLASPVVGISNVPSAGYRLVQADGSTSAFGAAVGTSGPTGATAVGIAPLGVAGAWVATSAGGIATVGTATSAGQVSGPLAAPVSGIASTGGPGYVLCARDGGVFTFGNAAFAGSMGGRPLNAPVVGIATSSAEVN